MWASLPQYSILFLVLMMNSLVNADEAQFIKFDDESLTKGREVWLDNCKGCHGFGIAGAPIPMNPDDWRKRVSKLRAVLYQHAIEGFFGEDDTMMPERGGNPDLSDSQVKSAVDYMVALAIYYIKKTGKQFNEINNL